jgi:hypothetical protein
MSSSSSIQPDPSNILVVDNLKLLEHKHSSTTKYTLSILTEVYIKENGIIFLSVEDYNGTNHVIKYDHKNPAQFMWLENENLDMKVICITCML